MRILIVEDHQKINRLLTRFCEQDNHRVVQAFSAEEALNELHGHPFDVIITDLMLPDMQGEELIEKIRAVSDVYIMVISAKTDLEDRLDVFSMGADDYLTKPFAVDEVMAKLKNVEKRLTNAKPTLLSFNGGTLTVHPLERRVMLNGASVAFTAHEYDVFYHLLSHPNRIFGRDELLVSLFIDSEAYDRVIDVYVKNIRRKLHDDPKSPAFIETVYGVGYRFVGEKDD